MHSTQFVFLSDPTMCGCIRHPLQIQTGRIQLYMVLIFLFLRVEANFDLAEAGIEPWAAW